jgi:thioredoxin 1
MKISIQYISFVFAAIFFSANIFAQEKLTPKKFNKKLQATTNAFLLDVRTPKEVSRSYIKNAVFMDIHDSLFEKRLTTIDKKMRVFVYCAIGVRSHDAALMLNKLGFTEVYDLKGGIINWKLDGLPVIKGKDFDSRKGMGKEEFIAGIKDKPLVFIDFYAPWCAPCQIMVPALDSMVTQMKDTAHIVKINADENLGLMKELHFNSLPYIMIYKNGVNVFRQEGFMSRNDMEMLIRKYYN